MIELLQFLFATEKDQHLYFNKNALVKELLNEHRFTFGEVKDMLEWFAPIVDSDVDSEFDSDAIREISVWEKERLPNNIIEQIMHWERDQLISSNEREILFDRLSMLCLNCMMDSDEGQIILEGLIFHIQNYKPQLTKPGGLAGIYCYPSNFTVH